MAIIPTTVRPWPFHSTPRSARQPVVTPPLTPFERFRAAYPDFVARLAMDNKYRARQLDLLGTLPPADQRNHVRKLLGDRKLHRLYAYHAIRQARRLGNANPEIVAALATRFNAFAPVTNEQVTLRLVDKGNGRRWVHDYGLRRRMQQKLVADILRQLHPPPRTQSLFNGGMPMARSAIAAAYCDGGFTHGVEVDFIRFYSSVQRPALADLLRPLPTNVVEHVVWDVALRDDPGLYAVVGTMPAPTSSLSTGLFLGSATSPIVGERIVADLLAQAGEPDTITYADNLFVMGRSRREVEARIDRIRESVASKPEVGSLELREGVSFGYDLAQPFEFLKQEGVAVGDGFEWRPGMFQQGRYQIGDAEHYLSADQIAAAEKRVRYWRRSYPDWPEGNVREAIHLAELAARRFYIDGNASNRAAAVHAVIIAWMADGQTRGWGEFLPDAGGRAPVRREALISELNCWYSAAIARVPVAA